MRDREEPLFLQYQSKRRSAIKFLEFTLKFLFLLFTTTHLCTILRKAWEKNREGFERVERKWVVA